MKKFVIPYVIISVLLFVAVYFITLLTSESSRETTYFSELMNAVSEKKDLEDLVKYQTTAYKLLEKRGESTFYYEIYHITFEAESGYYNQVVTYIVPLNLKLATSSADESDKTDIIYYYNNEIHSHMKESDSIISVSNIAYKNGLFFYAATFESDIELNLEVTDYQGDVILDRTLPLLYQKDESNPEFLPGLTPLERYEISGIADFQRYHLLITIPIFLVMDIGIGAFIYFWRRRKKDVGL